MEEFINGFLSVGLKVLCFLHITPYVLGKILGFIVVSMIGFIITSFFVEFILWVKNLIFGKNENQN